MFIAGSDIFHMETEMTCFYEFLYFGEPFHKCLCSDDMNADLSDNSSLFANCGLRFCDDNNLILSTQILLPADSFSYISEAWHTTSWLDHCISTADANYIFRSIETVYEASISDRIPFVMTTDCDSLPELSQEVKYTPKS